ncbi:ABC transporter permease [Sphingobacterium corticibacter]|uniref:ABC transporter permease n=1 Tax=Sphingobacterium corticibacter TaxID=2171749 RepID=A0A2T8HLA2_9SPHI|nr:ABC transporter permease [Sphingobacterium corticibacter]PVH26170.1 ABC transporter permease [Sphingobacterium corticibacter]
MTQTYFKTAWRAIRKNQGFTFLNIFGLAMGITCFMLLCAYLVHEWNYDRFYPNIDRLAWVSYGYKGDSENEYQYVPTTPTAAAPTLKNEFAEVEEAIRLAEYSGEGVVKTATQTVVETQLMLADEGFFQVLNYPFVQGALSTELLSEPYQIVITQDLAKKYFRDQSALGQTLVIDNQPWKVTGVVENPPTNTRFNFHAVLSNKHLKRFQEQVWHSANDVTLLLLKNADSFDPLQKQVTAFIDQRFRTSPDKAASVQVNIEKLSDVHLFSKAGRGNLMYIYIFAALAVAIIVLASVNFTNLILARSSERAKEVGVKKVLGAARYAIFYQFLLECALMISIATLIGLFFTWLLLPAFSQYIGVEMQLQLWREPLFYLALILFTVFMSLLGGGWPAWMISCLRPLRILKGKGATAKEGFGSAKALVVLQFCISLLFITCTLFATRQLQFLQQTNTGLNREQVIVLNGSVLKDADRTALKNDLLRLNAVKGVTASYDSPVSVQGGYTASDIEGKGNDVAISVTAIPVEKDFLTVFEIPIVAGENLTEADILRARDTSTAQEYSFMINKLAAQAMGFSQDEAIGKRMNLNGRIGRIKTVVDNFNFASLKEEVQPIVIFPEYDYFGNIFVKVDQHADMAATLGAIGASWKRIKPDIPFESHFLDDDYAALYKHERQTAKIMGLFSGITISIACLGLFALSAYAAQQRIKEIGIRKVLGASVARIVTLLTIDFVTLVIIALCISIPITWWIMHRWLEEFTYHINIEWWIFLIAGVATIAIAFLTVSFQAIRAALANPINSLRDE